MLIDTDAKIIILVMTIIVGAIGLGLMLTGIRGRNKGIRSCPHCRHLLTTENDLRCPECGRHAGSERRALRANRRLVNILWGILLIGGAIFCIQQLGLDQVNIYRRLPDRVLTMMLPYSSGQGRVGPQRELSERLTRGRLDDATRAALFERLTRGDGQALPGTPQWRRKYGMLIQSLRKSVAGDDPLSQRFNELKPVVDMELPRFWPEDLPLFGMLRMTRFDRGSDPAEVRIEGLEKNALTFIHHQANRSPNPLGLPLPEDRPASIPVRIMTTDEDGDRRFHEVDVDLQARSPRAITLEPRSTSEMETALRTGVFAYPVSYHPTGKPPWSLRFQPRATRRAGAFQDTLVGVEVDLLLEDKIARRSWIWWTPREADAAWETIHEHPELLEAMRTRPDGWSLRITGRREIAARALVGSHHPHRHYWEGTFTMPIETAVRSGVIQPREWERALEEPDHKDQATTGSSIEK